MLQLVDLHAAMERLFVAVEERLGSEIEFPLDYYWNVPTGDAYDLGSTHQDSR